jgi:hypothetical protein
MYSETLAFSSFLSEERRDWTMFVISGSGALEQDARYQDDDAPRHR